MVWYDKSILYHGSFRKGDFIMSEKRRDSKNRILQNGESQRKDGKYEFKYVDVNGTRRSAYSWKLVATDKVPEGKKSYAISIYMQDANKTLTDAQVDKVMSKIKHQLENGLNAQLR